VRQLHISLAAKCQLLFGAAVVLIIAAALFVPAYRIEVLMDQLDEAAAQTLARQLMVEHLSRQTVVGTAFADPNESATTQPTEPSYMPPRLVRVLPPADLERLTTFEKRAISDLLRDPTKGFYDRYYAGRDNDKIYKYAQPLYLEPACVNCHSITSSDARPPNLSALRPTTLPTTQQSEIYGLVSIEIPSQIQPNQLLLNRVFILTAGLLAGTLAVFVFYLITTRLILQPVRVLQETAEKVSEGDLNIRSDISTGDEFQQLSETFNTMLTNLKVSADQLRAVNKSLDLKIGQMAESNVALYESNRLKSEFLANVSHELRTPLNSILGFAELVQESVKGNPDAKTTRYIQNILNSGRNLLDLINDLLDLAKIEAGRMEVRSEPLSLNDLFEGLTNIIKPLAEPKALGIEHTIAADVPIIQTDPAKLQQVLYNFLSNAIKFSPQSGAITLGASRDGEDRVRISVTDQGPGIEPEKHQVIFEKFRQIDGSVTRQHSGTGLGLAISKELVTLLGGTIGIDSTPGQGASFWLILPLKIEAGDQDVRSRLVLT
jgi:signal transduction histidine kinase